MNNPLSDPRTKWNKPKNTLTYSSVLTGLSEGQIGITHSIPSKQVKIYRVTTG